MSRGQQQAVIDTASGENKSYNADAKTSFDTTQKDISGYGAQVGGFLAKNPYVQGGQAQTAENQGIADTAAGLAESDGQTMQGAAVRTGQNAGGAIAATEDMNERNMRALTADEAAATDKRLAAGTGYAEAGLEGFSKVPVMENQVASEQGQLAQGALNTQEQAAQTPGFLDQVTGDILKGGAQIGTAWAGKKV